MRDIKKIVRERDVWNPEHIRAYNKSEKGVQAYLDTLPIEPIDRHNLDPMTIGYCTAALDRFPFHEIWDITTRTITEMSRDCVKFYWANRYTLENVWKRRGLWDTYDEYEAGKEFWYSREGLPTGFIQHNDPFADNGSDLWDQMHYEAVKLGRYVLKENSKGKIQGHNEI